MKINTERLEIVALNSSQLENREEIKIYVT